MNKKDVNITGCKIGKAVSIDYDDLIEDRVCNVKDDVIPHPDLTKAIQAFSGNLAEAFYNLSAEKQNFTAEGFHIVEKDGFYFVVINGKMESPYGDEVKINSGKIPYDHNEPDYPITSKVMDAKAELFAYLWEGKASQQKIDFPEEGGQPPAEE